MEKDFFTWTQNPATCPIDMNYYTSSCNWDQNDPFESALSSMVSSPAAARGGGDGGCVQLIELIGKLGSIGSPHRASFIHINQSGNNSCYSTPMNSPKLDLSTQLPAAVTPFETDPEFAERAARFSSFVTRSLNERSQRSVNAPAEMSDNKLHSVASCQLPRSQFQPDSIDASSVSHKVQSNDAIGGRGRKRKSIEIQSSKVGADSNDSNTKRTKSDKIEKSGKSAVEGNVNENSKPPEPLKDYIHVRARRGQATDSHSLAERVRREKISERMKFLQDLVPGCNKVTGKAVMLDEIINYVQLLQRQVEFLSMKLSTVNPRMDSVHIEALLYKELILQPQADSASAGFPYAYPSREEPQVCMPNAAATDTQFCNSASQVSMWEDELHNVVQMGFTSSSMEPCHMKMEP